MNSETESQREILIKMVKQIDLSKLSDSKLRKIINIINIIIQEEQKPVVTTKSDNIEIIMEKCYREAQDIINNKEKVNNKEAPKIIPMTPYEPKYGWKPIWNVELQS